MEEFEEIKDFEDYKINKKGEIWSNYCGRIKKPSFNDNGYLYVVLYKNGKMHAKKVHRLLGIQFIENPDNLPMIDHIDNNRQNNCLENLRWVDNITNCNNKIKRGGIYWHKNGWRAQINIFGKRYSKYSKDKSVCEEWLLQILENHEKK